MLGGWEDEAQSRAPRGIGLHCETSIDRLLGRDVVESELLEETETSFRDAVVGLPTEDVEAIQDFIRFVRERRRRKRAGE